MELTTAWVVEWMRLAAITFDEHRVELGSLDREIGDGDHGENMSRGFSAVWISLSDRAEHPALEEMFRGIAMTLISRVGGAAGPLYGTAFLRAGESLKSSRDVDAHAVADLLQAGYDGIVARGKAAPGDKTMVDAWAPAVAAAFEAANAGESAQGTLDAAASAAFIGAEETEPLVARKGRASYLGARSKGHRDPGAESTALLLQAAAEAAANV